MNENQTGGEEKTIRPTKKQQELLLFIEAFIVEHGYSPSYREIMTGLEYTSVATVALHVNNLIKRGHLVKRDHSARSLEVVNPTGETPPTPLPTNQVKASDEKWLVDKVEHLLAEAESSLAVEQSQIDDLYLLTGAMKVLGLDGAAQSFMPRLSALKTKLAERQHELQG